MRQTTIKDIARHSGFSVTTVSRVLSGSGYPISDRARKAIEKSAAELRYFPNMLARSLKTNSSTEVAIIIPTIGNPFFTDMVSGIGAGLSERGYNMLIYLGGKYGRGDNELVASLNGRITSGVIVAADCISGMLADGLVALQQKGVPVIVTDYATEAIAGLKGIYFDYRKGGEMAADYLASRGHVDIALCTRVVDRNTRRSFVEGVCGAMKKNGVNFSDADIFQCDAETDFEAGEELGRRLLASQRRYTAVTVNNDGVAVGVLSVLTRGGVRVPDDVSIIGFDDSVFSRMSTPLLTTVCMPARNMGMLAAQFLFDALKGNVLECNISIEPRIAERQTVARR